MQVHLIVAYRRLRKHPSLLRIMKAWVPEEGAGRRLNSQGLLGTDKLPEGLFQEELTLCTFDDRTRNPKVVVFINPESVRIDDEFMQGWQLNLKLAVNRPTPIEGRILMGTLTIESAFENSKRDLPKIKWEEPFENTLYDGLEMNSTGLFIIPGIPPVMSIDGCITSNEVVPDDFVTLEECCHAILNFLEDMSTEPQDVYELLDGQAVLHGIQVPHPQLLRYMREICQNPFSSETKSDIVDSLHSELCLLEAVINILIKPFLESEVTTMKHLATTILNWERQLKVLIVSEHDSRFPNLLKQLECVNTSQIIGWIVFTNPDFFLAHLEEVLHNNRSNYKVWLERSRLVLPKIKQVFADLVSHRSEESARQAISKESNYLYKADCRFSDLPNPTLLECSAGWGMAYRGYYLGLEKKTLVMWKTTTAEDRARGKIYLRGFTKVDPVEDRLQM